MKVSIGHVKRLINEALKPDAKMATRFVGTCGFCEREQRVQDDRLVLHGYKRPGDGVTHGECPGARQQPFELSPKTAQLGLDYFSNQIRYIESELNSLDDDPLNYQVQVGFKNVQMLSIKDAVERRKPFSDEIRKIYADDMIKNVRRSLESKQQTFEMYVKKYENKIKNWAKKPLRTFEEDVAQKSAVKDERKTTADAKRQAKHDELKDKLLGRVNSAFTKLQSMERKYCAFEGKPLNDVSYKLADEMFDKHRNIYNMIDDNAYKLFDIVRNTPGSSKEKELRDLGIDDVLTHLGILKNGTYEKYNSTDTWKLGPKRYEIWTPFWPGYR